MKALQREVHEIAVSKGWWPAYPSILDTSSRLALVHEEVSEAHADLRTAKIVEDLARVYYDGPKIYGFPTELADIVIRVLDLAEALRIDLEEVIRMKVEYNRLRPFRHGGKTL